MNSLDNLLPCFSNFGSMDLDHSLRLSCQNCDFKDEQAKLLLEEVHLLRDIINTCQVYKQMNQSLYSNLVDACTQTDSGGIAYNSDIETETILEAGSYLLMNSAGDIEAPSSLFNKSNQVDQMCPVNESKQDFYIGAISDVSSKDLSVSSDRDLEMHSDVSSAPCSDSVSKPVNSTELGYVKPIELYDKCLFSQFSIHTLVDELNFSHKFNNRSALYFGKYTYTYKGGRHDPRMVKPDSYLDKLCSYLDVVLPDFKYNSVLVHLFQSGEQTMPSHSDDEECIEDGSDIITVSLGATRNLVFKDTVSDRVVHTTKLFHGSVSCMSKTSQRYYRHEIPKEPECKEPRVSLTFRLIKPVNPLASFKPVPTSVDSNLCGHVPFSESGPTVNSVEDTPERAPRVDSVQTSKSVLYISSSMFRFLDTKELSTSKVSATKLFYPGANGSVMLNKLRQDLPGLTIKPCSIYIMCGTNNVNSIYYGSATLGESFDQLTKVLQYLQRMFPDAAVNVVNILPRTTPGKNDVVRELNSLLKNYCQAKKMKFMETKHLFNTASGARRNQYFVKPSDKIVDNCHLNQIGVSRLGKFLKFWTHSHLKSTVTRH